MLKLAPTLRLLSTLTLGIVLIPGVIFAQVSVDIGGSSTGLMAWGDGSIGIDTPVQPNGVVTDNAGRIYFVDPRNFSLRRKTAGVNGTTERFAGIYTSGTAGLGGPALNAQLQSPSDVDIDSLGQLVIADNGRILIIDTLRNINLGTTAISTYSLALAEAADALLYADNGTSNGPVINSVNYPCPIGGCTGKTVFACGGLDDPGDNGPATSARCNSIRGISVCPSGRVMFADRGRQRIRSVFSGIINTIAGNGNSGFAGDGGPATSAQLRDPNDVYCISDTDFIIADTGNKRVRRVQNGVINTILGNGLNWPRTPVNSLPLQQPVSLPQFLTRDKLTGHLLVSSPQDFMIWRLVLGSALPTPTITSTRTPTQNPTATRTLASTSTPTIPACVVWPCIPPTM